MINISLVGFNERPKSQLVLKISVREPPRDVSSKNVVWLGSKYTKVEPRTICFSIIFYYIVYKMVLSNSNKELIQSCFTEEGWRGVRIINEFCGKMWYIISKQWCIFYLFCLTWSTERKVGNGWPKTACTQENYQHVEEPIFSQEVKPGTHKSQKHWVWYCGIPYFSLENDK